MDERRALSVERREYLVVNRAEDLRAMLDGAIDETVAERVSGSLFGIPVYTHPLIPEGAVVPVPGEVVGDLLALDAKLRFLRKLQGLDE